MREPELMDQATWDDAPIPFQLLDPDGNILAVNSAWCALTGYDAHEVERKDYFDLIPQEHAEEFRRNMATLAETGTLEAAPCFIQRKDGSIRNVLVFARIHADDNGETTRCMLVDSTGLKRTEERLAESEARFRNLFELAPTPIVVHDGVTVAFANTAAARFLGFESVRDLEGTPIAPLVHPDSRPLVAERVKRMMTEDWTAPMTEEAFVRADGTTVWGETIASPVVFDGRRLIHVVAVDSTEKRATAQKLETYRLELERLVAERTASLHRAKADLAAITAVVGLTVEMTDPYTAGHQIRVAELCKALGTRLQLTTERLEALDVAARMHDVGKIAVPPEILSKPARLSPVEYELVKSHAQAGYQIVSSANLHEPIAEIVRQHHERIDGSGYPNGLSGEELLTEARILMVADVFEAMASHRPYRPALGSAAALEELRRGAGVCYDAEVVTACEELITEGFDFSAS